MNNNEQEFTSLAEGMLLKIVDTIEVFDKEGLIDIDFNTDVINLTTPFGIFIINKNSAAQEIWLASPISGPYHFSYQKGRWRSKYNKDLLDILATELKIKFNKI